LFDSEALQVDGVENRKHVQADIERSLGIIESDYGRPYNFCEIAVVGDESKDFIGEAGHGGKGFDFLIGEARNWSTARWTTLLLSRMSVRRASSPFMANCTRCRRSFSPGAQ